MGYKPEYVLHDYEKKQMLNQIVEATRELIELNGGHDIVLTRDGMKERERRELINAYRKIG